DEDVHGHLRRSATGAKQRDFTTFPRRFSYNPRILGPNRGRSHMAYTVNKVDVWTGEIDDKVGGLAAKLEPLAGAGVDLGFLIAPRQPQAPGKGVVFLGPVTGAKGSKAAKGVGLSKTTELAALRLEGPNKPGAASELMRALADAGINLRGVSASV